MKFNAVVYFIVVIGMFLNFKDLSAFNCKSFFQNVSLAESSDEDLERVGLSIFKLFRWISGYPKEAKIITRGIDVRDIKLIELSYYFEGKDVFEREVMLLELIGGNESISSNYITNDDFYSVTGVYEQLYQWTQGNIDFSKYHTLHIRHTHPGFGQYGKYVYKKKFSDGDRSSARKLRLRLSENSRLKHLILRESIIFEKGRGKEPEVKTYELRP